MKNSKSVLLILLGLGLMFTWIYHLYDKKDYSNHQIIVYVKDTTFQLQAKRDSLHQVFRNAVTDFSAKLTSLKAAMDSTDRGADTQFVRIYALRQEIRSLLHEEPITSAGMILASQKIGELKQQTQYIRDEHPGIEAEKRRLHKLLKKMTANLYAFKRRMENPEHKK